METQRDDISSDVGLGLTLDASEVAALLTAPPDTPSDHTQESNHKTHQPCDNETNSTGSFYNWVLSVFCSFNSTSSNMNADPRMLMAQVRPRYPAIAIHSDQAAQATTTSKRRC